MIFNLLTRLCWVAMAIFLVGCSTGTSTSSNSKGYLFAYFTKNGEDGLHYAASRDGYHWRKLNQGNSYLAPNVGNSKLMRDPCIVRGPDGTYHMVWTSGWNEKNIGYASSKDLIHWSGQKEIPVMAHEPDVRNSWAPEVVYDKTKREFIIFWASTIPGTFAQTHGSSEEKYNHRLYYTTTKDFSSFAPTQLFYDPGFSVIDATFLRFNNKLQMIIKDETLNPVKKYLQLASAKSYLGSFGVLSDAISPSGIWVEGPTAVQIGDEAFIYYDAYTSKRYGALRSKDLVHWEDVSAQMDFPDEGTPLRMRHGTVIEVSAKELERLGFNEAAENPPMPAVAPKPLFRDPVHDGAADASLIQNRTTGQWEMFYTNRRADMRLADKNDVTWVHGTHIGMATSQDGNHWSYTGVAQFPDACNGATQWAPEIFWEQGTYHLWLTIVPGVYAGWKGKPYLQHLTSKDLRAWQCGEKLELGSDNIIDASVLKLSNGKYRLWFKDQNQGSRIFYADSDDLVHWQRKDKVLDRNAEGPKIFKFGDRYWLVADIWRGLMVLASDDAEHWVEQPERLLPDAGTAVTDKAKGQHPDIQVIGDRAFIFYFVHQENEVAAQTDDRYGQRTVIQVAELKIENGKLVTDRNAGVDLRSSFGAK